MTCGRASSINFKLLSNILQCTIPQKVVIFLNFEFSFYGCLFLQVFNTNFGSFKLLYYNIVKIPFPIKIQSKRTLKGRTRGYFHGPKFSYKCLQVLHGLKTRATCKLSSNKIILSFFYYQVAAKHNDSKHVCTVRSCM